MLILVLHFGLFCYKDYIDLSFDFQTEVRSEDNSQIKLTRLQEKGFKDGSLYFLNIRIPCVFLTSERSSGFKFSWVFVA